MNQDDIRALAKKFNEFDAEPEVQALYKRGVKYITDSDVRETISPELEVKLQAIEKLAEEHLVNAKGGPELGVWNALQTYGVWVRQGKEDVARVTTKSISVGFDCF